MTMAEHIKKDNYELYQFLCDGFFHRTSTNYRIMQQIEKLPPHEIFQETSLCISNIDRCGKKTLVVVTNIIENFRNANRNLFCTCGEPYLHWYKFCPECGKEREA